MSMNQERGTGNVDDAVSAEELSRLVERLAEQAAEHGRIFTGLDESVRLQSERRWAEYLQTAARSVGMEDLAERLDPQQFAPGLFEKAMGMGRSLPRSRS
jgi:hypothetical protein